MVIFYIEKILAFISKFKFSHRARWSWARLPLPWKKYPLSDATEPKTAVRKIRCARTSQTRYLPRETVSDILSRVPAQVLPDVMRHVCREWNLVIRSQDFIHHHLRNSTTGIMIQDMYSGRDGIYVELRRGCLEISKFDCGFDDLVWSSCDGLVLSYSSRNSSIHVTNPLTKQRAIVPPYFPRRGLYSDFGLAFAEASMEYKVVRACGEQFFSRKKQIAVLTIGVDKVWRHIDITHLFLPTERSSDHSPLVTGGYVHWLCDTFVLTFNVETETVRRFPLPQLPRIWRRCLPMGSNLSFVSESLAFFMQVWEMNSETGEWRTFLELDLEPLRDRFNDVPCKYAETIIGLGWLAVREVLVLSTIHFQKRCIAYNVKTGETQSFELATSAKSHHFRAHVNSLVWLGGLTTKETGNTKPGLSCA